MGLGALPQDSRGKPWNGDYVFSSGDLVEDLTHNFFLETGARNGKLKVYETVEHPAARALTGYLLVRGGVHQVAVARAVERLTGADLIEAVPVAADPHGQDPRVPAAHQASGDHLRLYRFSPDDYKELAAVFNGTASGDRRGTRLSRTNHLKAFPAHDLPAQPSVFAPDYAPEEIVQIAEKLRATAGPAGRAHRRRGQRHERRRRQGQGRGRPDA